LIPFVFALGTLATACQDEKAPTDGGGGAGGEAGGSATEPRYALSSMVWDEAGNTTTYINLLASLGVEKVTNAQAREFAGAADLWVFGDAVFVADSVSFTVEKFEVRGGELEQVSKTISFASHGVSDFGFWRNVFVNDEKAYVMNGPNQMILWNPKEMTIGATIDIPGMGKRGALEAYSAYSDRAAVIRDNKLYQPVYYTDLAGPSFFTVDGGSSLIVLDLATDTVLSVAEIPCPGIDFASQDDDGNIYFSSWVYAPAGAAVIGQPPTCVAKLEVGSDEPRKLFDVADEASGHQGGMFRYIGNGKAFLSVLHEERDDSQDPSVVAYGPNWKFWLYDLATGKASEDAALPYNAGAAYDVKADGKPYLLVPAGDYTSTQLFALHADGTADAAFTATGWALRLFDLPKP
jgi:hypothetical protein